MADPTIPTVLKKLLSLDTPVSLRIFETALLLGLILCSAYVKEHTKDEMVLFATNLIGVMGGMILLAMLVIIGVTVVANAKRDHLDKK